MKKFSPPRMKEVSLPTPHTLTPTPSFKSGGSRAEVSFYLLFPVPLPYRNIPSFLKNGITPPNLSLMELLR